MGEQAETEKEKKKSMGVMDLLSWLAIILVVYVLSIGPVIRMYDKRVIPNTTKSDRFLWDGFYLPVVWAYESTPLHKPLGMYFHLWSNNLFDRNGEVRIRF